MMLKKLEDILNFLQDINIDNYSMGTVNDVKILDLFVSYTSKVKISKLKDFGFIILQKRIPIDLRGEKCKTLLQIKYYE